MIFRPPGLAGWSAVVLAGRGGAERSGGVYGRSSEVKTHIKFQVTDQRKIVLRRRCSEPAHGNVTFGAGGS